MLDEIEFRNHSDEALLTLKNALMDAEEDGGFEAEEQNGVLNVLFPHGTKFVFTPNSPVRQIWISARTTSFKLDWDEATGAFVLPKTGENLLTLTARLLREQTGNADITLA
ncbi:MAG TPA: iron donor protein CyaY [Acidobacteriaceae bacterium]